MRGTYLAILVSFITIISFSCSKDSETKKEEDLKEGSIYLTGSTSEAQKDEDLILWYSKCGVIHNNVLDIIYDSLNDRADKLTDKIPLYDMNQLVFNYLEDTLSISDVDLTKFYLRDTSFSESGYSSVSLEQHLFNVTGQTISEALSNALSQFEDIFRSETLRNQYYLYDSLVTELVPTLGSEDEKAAFIATVSVGKHSLQYWASNLTKWEELQDRIASNIGLRMMHRGEDIAYADASSAFAGAIVGAKIGLASGTVTIPGVGTAVGGACGVLVGTIGGAITGSAAAGVEKIVRWLIGW